MSGASSGRRAVRPEPCYRALLEDERARWPNPKTFETCRQDYASECARGFCIMDLLARYAGWKPDAARVLDIGCGGAGTLVAFAEAGAVAAGVEPDSGSLPPRVGPRRGARGERRPAPWCGGAAPVRGPDCRCRRHGQRALARSRPTTGARRGASRPVAGPAPLRRHAQAVRALQPVERPALPADGAHAHAAGGPGRVRRTSAWPWTQRVRRRHDPDAPAPPGTAARRGFAPIAPPRGLSIHYLRDRVSRPDDVSAGIKRRVAGWLGARRWTIEGGVARWFWDVAFGANVYLCRREGS